MDNNDNAGVEFENSGSGIMVDLRDVQEMSFEAIPPGLYDAVIDQCKYEISKNSQQPMWNMRFSIMGGDYNNRKLFMYISFSEKALPGTKTLIKNFAPELLAGAFDPKKIADESVFIGRAVRLKVKLEDYKPDNGEVQKRNRVQDVFAQAGGNGFAG